MSFKWWSSDSELSFAQTVQSATSVLFFHDDNFLEIQPRLKPRRFTPDDVRLIYLPWVLSGLLILISCIVIISYGIQFGANKSLSFMKSNLAALVLAVVLVEPVRLKAWAALDTLLRPQLDKWEWLHPIHDYITVELYDEEDYEKVEMIQNKLRRDDDRYQPIGNVHFSHISFSSTSKTGH